MSRPTLTIAIPTYNRREHLLRLLAVLRAQVREQRGRVELVVSDNGSTDDTQAAILSLARDDQVRYFRNTRNLGAAANIRKLVERYAEGEFVWIIGDDDMVATDAIPYLLQILKKYPSYDYVFLNYVYFPVCEGDTLAIPSASWRELGRAWKYCGSETIKPLARWEEIVGETRDAGMYTALISHVFRRTLWDRSELVGDIGPWEDCFALAFPHLASLYRNLVGRPAIYVGRPMVALLTGAQDWFEEKWGRLLYGPILEFGARLEVAGVDREWVRHFKGCVLKADNDGHLRSAIRGARGRVDVIRFLARAAWWSRGDRRFLAALQRCRGVILDSLAD